MEITKIPARADVPDQDKWAINDLFATDDDWRAALAGAKEFVPRVAAYRGRLGESGETLLAFSGWTMRSASRLTRSCTTPSAKATRIPALQRIRRWSAR